MDTRTDAIERRRQILEAATRVFARSGFHGSRVSDIASEAGIAYGLVYHYFKNKDEILDTVFRESWALFIEILEAVERGHGSTRDKLMSSFGCKSRWT